ncbi:hypothetical protein N7493_008998 [Penicillium malachiteum]|uniref:Uncharacterized protein n=1 Tax=Penicillium malachiteum TaxID=1324776 RepID=A0AAD6HFP3_9EURO|nr:hypothetical protein N7493_008998 [Penicillium malachiteum]
MVEDVTGSLAPRCVASTPSPEVDPAGAQSSSDSSETIKSPYFSSAEWTPDGTTLLTNSSDHRIRSFIVPPDLLETGSVHNLSPYSALPSAEPTYALAAYPFFNLQDPSTTLFLSSVRDHPIRLASALAPVSVASYSLVNPTTEAFITPHSMIYPSTLGGTHFLTGSDSLICLFDVSRPGSDGPVSWLPTIPSKRKQTVGGGIGMKGIVSAMAISPTGDGILAAGTFTRQVGLYSSNGSDWRKGVTQLAWSPCGRYLYIAERKSDGVLVYDIRVTGQMLGYLRGRRAVTNQRMKIDVISAATDSSHEVWAGGTDGYMRGWKNPVYAAGGQDPDWEFKVHDDAVTSIAFHSTGSVVATSCGQRHYLEHDNDSDSKEKGTFKDKQPRENSLKIWFLPS